MELLFNKASLFTTFVESFASTCSFVSLAEIAYHCFICCGLLCGGVAGGGSKSVDNFHDDEDKANGGNGNGVGYETTTTSAAAASASNGAG
jgi:hypothetical protein